MPTFTCGDIDICYQLAGVASGPRIVFINGTGGDLRAPSALRDEFERHGLVAAYDQRGLGRSSKPDRPYSMADYASDVNEFLDHLEWDSAAIYGISFGGMVAQELAVTWPERVERLALSCTSSGGAGRASYPLHQLVASGDERADVVARIELGDTRRDAAWRASHPEHLETMVEMSLAARAIGRGEPDREIGARRQLEARSFHDTFERLHRITMPCLIQGGRSDGIAPPANLAALAEAIPNSELRMYKGGHLFHLQDRTATPDVIEFLTSTSPPTTSSSRNGRTQ